MGWDTHSPTIVITTSRDLSEATNDDVFHHGPGLASREVRAGLAERGRAGGGQGEEGDQETAELNLHLSISLSRYRPGRCPNEGPSNAVRAERRDEENGHKDTY